MIGTQPTCPVSRVCDETRSRSRTRRGARIFQCPSHFSARRRAGTPSPFPDPQLCQYVFIYGLAEMLAVGRHLVDSLRACAVRSHQLRARRVRPRPSRRPPPSSSTVGAGGRRPKEPDRRRPRKTSAHEERPDAERAMNVQEMLQDRAIVSYCLDMSAGRFAGRGTSWPQLSTCSCSRQRCRRAS